MQILLKALYSEVGGKKPELQIEFLDADDEQVVFSELFFSETVNNGNEGSKFKDNTNTIINWFAAEDQKLLQDTKTDPDIEVLLPMRKQQVDKASLPIDPRMIDITPKDASLEGIALQEDFTDATAAPIAAPQPIAKLEDSDPKLQTPSSGAPLLIAPRASQSSTPFSSKKESVELKNWQYASPPKLETASQLPDRVRGTYVLTDASEAISSVDPRSHPVNNAKDSPRPVLEVDPTQVREEPGDPIAETRLKSAAITTGLTGSTTTLPSIPPVTAAPIEQLSDQFKSEQRPIDAETVATELTKPKIQNNAQSATTASQTPFTVVGQAFALEGKSNQEQIVELGTTLHSREIDENRLPTPAVARAEAANARPVVNQVIQIIMRSSFDGMVEVRLQPEELGRVRLAMTQLDAGVTVHITAERPETLDLLRRNVDMLESNLRDQGFENASFTFGQDDPSTKEQTEKAVSSGDEPDATFLRVDVNSEQTLTLEGRLDIRL